MSKKVVKDVDTTSASVNPNPKLVATVVAGGITKYSVVDKAKVTAD